MRHLGAQHAEREALVVARDVRLEAADRLELREHLGVVQRHRAQAGDRLEQLEILARVQRGLVLRRQLQHAAQAALRAHRHQQVAAPVRLGGPHRGPLVHALVHAGRAVRQPVEIGRRQHLGVLRRQPAHHRLLDRPTDLGDVALRREVVRELLQRRAEPRRRGEEQPGRDARAQRDQREQRDRGADPGDDRRRSARSCTIARSASQAMIAATSAPVSTGTMNIRRVSTAGGRQHVVPDQRVADRQRQQRRQERQQQVDDRRAGDERHHEPDREQRRHRGQAQRRRHQLLPAAAALAAQAHAGCSRSARAGSRTRSAVTASAERAQVEAQVRPDREHHGDGDAARRERDRRAAREARAVRGAARETSTPARPRTPGPRPSTARTAAPARPPSDSRRTSARKTKVATLQAA